MDPWEFGRTVRHWRDRVQPATVGVSVGGRRRATGLRREELAALKTPNASPWPSFSALSR